MSASARINSNTLAKSVVIASAMPRRESDTERSTTGTNRIIPANTLPDNHRKGMKVSPEGLERPSHTRPVATEPPVLPLIVCHTPRRRMPSRPRLLKLPTTMTSGRPSLIWQTITPKIQRSLRNWNLRSTSPRQTPLATLLTQLSLFLTLTLSFSQWPQCNPCHPPPT